MTTSFLSFKSFDAFSRDTDLVDNTEHYGSELKRQMAEQSILQFFNQIDFGEAAKPDFATFRKAMIGYLNLQQAHELNTRQILTIIDYNLPSNVERMWVLDLQQKKMLYNELVSHGRNNGNLYAANFSNLPNSNSSSLGFFLTAEIYSGKFGRAMRMDGMELGVNDLVRARGVVMHGADYVSKAIAESGRLGRSLGCPAVAWENKDAIIDTIKDKTVMFINGPDLQYEASSLLLNAAQAFDSLTDQNLWIPEGLTIL